ncbi:hypothetical protein SUGI_0544070 [Cryptomeria japonica]|uniref:disease resistance protein RPV1 n=1 Tax=Cryptomeria japonica TaxID=3369 RepID=UPI002408A1B0|nr:disease resistance protein RPV1 [Cryptomeria japonica]GLJ27722.1 hypothetical protein SUGI_0544070 [Cryptomeria japonica]
MLDSHSSKIIPIFCDIQPSDLRYVDKGVYAEAFQDHRTKGRVNIQQIDRWITALRKVSDISGVLINTEQDYYGERVNKITEIVLKEARKVSLDVAEYTVGLPKAVEHFEKEVLSPSKSRGINAVAIVGLGGSGKSTLVTHLYNSKSSQFQRCCFLSDVSKTKNDLPSLQQSLLRDLTRDQNLRIDDTRRGRSLIRDRLRGLTGVLVVFDDIDSTEQIDNLVFVKDVVGNGSLILVTSRDQSLFYSSKMQVYNVKLLGKKDARELFCWHAFGLTKPVHNLQNMVEELVRMCGGFPLALKVLAGQLYNERDPRQWKQRLESLRERLPKNVLKQIVMDSYESLDVREKEAFLDVAHFLTGENTDLVKRVLDGLNNDDGCQCLETLRQKCLVQFESADIICRRALQGESLNDSTGVWRRPKWISKIRMHDLVRDLAKQISRQKLPIRLCCSSDKMISAQDSAQKYDVRGVRRDEDHPLPGFLRNQDICGLKLLSVQNFSILRKFKNVSGDLTWFRLRQSEDTLNPSPLSRSSFSNLIPSTLLLTSLRVLEVHGVNPQDFCNLLGDREPPSQLRALEVTCTKDLESVSTAGRSTAVSTKHGSASGTSHLLQPPINLGPWFQAWLGKLNFRTLGKIVLQNIRGLQRLPVFEEARNLRHVDLSGCSDLEVLPDSITEELLQLQYLALRGCRKLLLQDLGKICKLEYVDFQGCSMLRKMPRGTKVQKYLKHLNVVHTELRKLPKQLEQLEDLEELHIGSSRLTEMPSSLYNLSRLTDLTLLGCTNLHLIDNSIEKLVRFESFRIYNCAVKALPETIASCPKLKILAVQNCPLDSEQLLIGADSGNRPLNSSQPQGSTGQGSHTDRLGCLTDLIIRDSCISEIHIPRAGSLFPKLEILDLSNNGCLTKIGSLPGNLISLNLTNCSMLETLACLSSLARLKVLDISGCGEIRTLDVGGLKSIEEIKGNGCWKLRTILGLDLLEKLSCFQISFDHIYTPIAARLLDFPRVTLLKDLEDCMEASVEIKLEGAILLYLITDPYCQIEVAFRGHIYATRSSSFYNSKHLIMWTKDSEVFDGFELSKDKAKYFNIKIYQRRGMIRRRSSLQRGWIVEAKNELDMRSFLSSVFSTSRYGIQGGNSIQRGPLADISHLFK